MMSDKTYSAKIDREDTSSNEIIPQPFSPNDIELTNPPMNLGELIDRISFGWIDFGTEYQREENLWSPAKQSRLIESALLGLRLPAFYFEEYDKKKWKIIDGLQRCYAIRNYCVDGTLALCDLEFLDFNGYKFSDLPFELRRDIRMLPITVNLLSKGVPDKVKYILFKRLNTGGMNLEPQEIRNAVFQGKAIDTVKDLAKSEHFKKATCGSVTSKRMEDQDFVTRFMAFYLLGYDNYIPDLDNFMNTCLEGINNGTITDGQIIKMKSDFDKAMDFALQIFGSDAFRKRDDENANRRPINKAYFEVIAVMFAKLSTGDFEELNKKKDLFKNNLISVMRNDKTYSNSFSNATGRRDNVKKRFSVFSGVMKKSIKGEQIVYGNDKKSGNKKF